MKCSIVAIYQCKKLKQKEFSRIVLSEASARFENFLTLCKGKVKEMVTSTSHKVATERIFRKMCPISVTV